MHHTGKLGIKWENKGLGSQLSALSVIRSLLHHPQEFLRSLQLWKQLFLSMEFARVHATAAAPQLHRML
jgi:hypothetical protein